MGQEIRSRYEHGSAWHVFQVHLACHRIDVHILDLDTHVCHALAEQACAVIGTVLPVDDTVHLDWSSRDMTNTHISCISFYAEG